MGASHGIENRFSGSGPSPSQTLGLLSETSLTQLVNSAFRNYQSTLALSRSPLANSALVTPTLVLDDVSPTAEERGRGLRLVLRWAVDQIAPHKPPHALGEFRPFDDPTWSDPLWWRYNILRHRYIEPLHPDDFIGGRYTETLMALTGITSSDTFFDERNRAIQEVAERLRQQIIDGAGNQTLQQMAQAEALQLLERREDAARLLGIAAIFDDIFPRSLLLTMAGEEQIQRAEQVLDYLITNRLLLAGDAQRNLWLSPPFRLYIYQRQPIESLQRRHRFAARYYAEQEATLTTAKHWQHAALHERAATTLFAAAEELVNELQIAELIQVLQQFQERNLAIDHWREVQILLSDLYYRVGQPEEAVSACRRALKASDTPVDQARIYRRLGKLYVTRNQLHALGYYQQAAERFEPDSPELADLLKDRGWLHILRRSWGEAEEDLTLASRIAPADDAELQADVADALASLYRRQERFHQALQYAQRALTLREQLGNLPRIASSFNNLGIVYRKLGEFGQAIGAYEEALRTYQKLGNQEATAGALMNIGSAYFLMNRIPDAIDHYQQSLEICLALEQPHVEATVRYNLAEAYAALQHRAEAHKHWQIGYDLSQRAGFADEIQAFEQLRAETPLLQANDDSQSFAPAAPNPVPAAPPLPPDEQAVLTLAQTYGRLTAKDLVDALDISRATATRRLTALTEVGHLTQHGKGRGTYYTVADSIAAAHSAADQAITDDIPTAGPCPTTGTTTDTTTGTSSETQAVPLAANLATHLPTLRERYRVTDLTPTPSTSPMPRFTVRFAELPSLPEFCALRTYLTEITGVEIDLWPDLS
ncbi:MAG: tetratricopeptide repeat protein [Caldilineaceae bacterium]|nr:tetratricopeptide repeat protein [Caldilineaceae bacterium]